ncbi:MAG: glutathione peroxidase [Chitinophagaceae bacterium]|nr:glutathione peroxidase [Chitinophagaceae bacterium]
MSYRQSVLKAIYPLIMLPEKLFGSKNMIQQNTGNAIPKKNFYEMKIALNNGDSLDLNQFKGKKILLVNTASDCGYTAQYAELEKLYQTHKNKLVIIGFPANDFKEQEKKDDAAIAEFCKINYGVTFYLAKKSQVIKGAGQNPVFNWLSDREKNGWCNQEPKWNFCKYLVDGNGVLTGFFAQSVSPLDPRVWGE